MERIALYNDSFQNWKSHDILKAQLILTDLPYQLGANAYGSNPMWYNGGDNSNGESKLAGKSFFNTDSKEGFRISEFFHFCNNLLKKEPKAQKEAGCMVLFCALEQHNELKEYAKKYGFKMDCKCFFGSLHVFGKDDSVVEGGTGEMKKKEENKEEQQQ